MRERLQKMEVPDERAALLEAADRVGGVRKLAANLGISHNAMSQWRRVPHGHVANIAAICGVTMSRLRADSTVADARRRIKASNARSPRTAA